MASTNEPKTKLYAKSKMHPVSHPMSFKLAKLLREMEPYMQDVLDSYTSLSNLCFSDLSDIRQQHSLAEYVFETFEILFGDIDKLYLSHYKPEMLFLAKFCEELGVHINEEGLYIRQHPTGTNSLLSDSIAYTIGMDVLKRFPEKNAEDSTVVDFYLFAVKKVNQAIEKGLAKAGQ